MYAFEVEALDRREVRCQVEAAGRLRIGWRKWVTCEIRDISCGGARIAVAEGVDLPEQFEIKPLSSAFLVYRSH